MSPARQLIRNARPFPVVFCTLVCQPRSLTMLPKPHLLRTPSASLNSFAASRLIASCKQLETARTDLDRPGAMPRCFQ